MCACQYGKMFVTQKSYSALSDRVRRRPPLELEELISTLFLFARCVWNFSHCANWWQFWCCMYITLLTPTPLPGQSQDSCYQKSHNLTESLDFMVVNSFRRRMYDRSLPWAAFIPYEWKLQFFVIKYFEVLEAISGQAWRQRWGGTAIHFAASDFSKNGRVFIDCLSWRQKTKFQWLT